MKEEVQRISKLVAEGKLSPEDAADLIDAFYENEHTSAERDESRETPPPPPGSAEGAGGHGKGDPLKGFMDTVERMTREGI